MENTTIALKGSVNAEFDNSKKEVYFSEFGQFIFKLSYEEIDELSCQVYDENGGDDQPTEYVETTKINPMSLIFIVLIGFCLSWAIYKQIGEARYRKSVDEYYHAVKDRVDYLTGIDIGAYSSTNEAVKLDNMSKRIDSLKKETDKFGSNDFFELNP